MKSLSSSLALALALTLISLRPGSGAVINSNWQGDANESGNWSAAPLWGPAGVPNNGGGNTYNVTIPGTVYGGGPDLDTNATIANLTVSTVSHINGSPGFDLTVTGTTQLETGDSFGGVLNAAGDNLTLGTLTNYNAATQTLESGNMSVGFFGPGGTIRFHNANIVTNNGGLTISGAAQFRNQDNSANALANLAVNNGVVQFADGANFTTAGNFTNNSLLAVTNFFGGLSTTFTVTGSLTNFNAATGTLTGGYYVVSSTPTQAATIRFPGADIRHLADASIQLVGGANARITDLAGNDAFRNLASVQGGSFTSAGTATITPSGGTFSNSGATHTIDTGANITIQGNLASTNGGSTRINAPADSSNTRLTITGSALINGGSLDMGGQPGVNTQYHTELQVINGLEYRGAFLTGTGTTFADILFTQNAHVQPGHSPGQLTFQGALSFDSTTTTEIQLGGVTAGEQFDQIVQHGAAIVTLGGTLALSFIDGFENSVANADVFDILTSDQILSGSYSNVASGARLTTSDGIGSFVVTYAGQNKVRLSNFALTLDLTGAVSRQTHGAAGVFDLPLNLTGQPSVECRNSGGNYQLVFTFANNVMSGTASVMTGTGSVSGSPTFAGQTMTVNLAGVADGQLVAVALNNVTDTFAQVLPSTTVSVNMLVGDTNGDRFVNSGDTVQTRNRSGQTTTLANFRSDVNRDGSVNSGDALVVRSASGHSVP